MIDRLEEARLGAADEADIAALLAVCFTTPPTFEGRSYFGQRHHARLVLRDPGLVGHLAVQMRAARLGDRIVTLGGFAEVATHPDRRGEGIAARLVRAGIDEARAMRADFAALFGTAGLYAGAGFRTVPNRLRWVDVDGVRTGEVREEAGALMILPLGDVTWDESAPVDLVGGLW